ncbi:MAG TPA: amidohydrolase family protein [Acidimicrobiales bacterium]|nr:amidohydrolase family protein [Acidimicrobiales bacterium]
MSVLLPDPSPRPIRVPVISVDDHLIEPPDLFEGRVEARFGDRAPHIVEESDGSQAWLYEDQKYPNVGLNAVAGRTKESWSMDPARFDEMRPGCFDIHARIADMDLNGVWASVCFPSLVAGFCGAVFSKSKDPELGLACLRAWNDWHLDVWAGTYPDRIIALQLPWLRSVELAAEEVRRNAARGFKAVSFPEFPAQLGLPSIFTGEWDPFFAACEETSTVVCLHTGASAWAPLPSPGPPFELLPTLFPVNALIAAAEWLWSGVPLRFPGLSVAMSEGGIGWVPMLIDRVDYVLEHSASGNESTSWPSDLAPSEVLKRNFFFCTIDDPSVIELRHRIGIEHIMVESDYPHADSTWPDTQEVLAKSLSSLDDDELRLVAAGNAARLFRHPLPARDDWRTQAVGVGQADGGR